MALAVVKKGLPRSSMHLWSSFMLRTTKLVGMLTWLVFDDRSSYIILNMFFSHFQYILQAE